MSEMDKYYEILGLNPGASEEDIEEAYRILVKVWHPYGFPNDPNMQRIGDEKLKEINTAYNNLRLAFSKKQDDSKTSDQTEHAHSQSKATELPPISGKEQSSTMGKSKAVTGAYILIILGIIFLLSNLGWIPPIHLLVSQWWPIILIIVGILVLIIVSMNNFQS